jgi:hypothetical protein
MNTAKRLSIVVFILFERCLVKVEVYLNEIPFSTPSEVMTSVVPSNFSIVAVSPSRVIMFPAKFHVPVSSPGSSHFVPASVYSTVKSVFNVTWSSFSQGSIMSYKLSVCDPVKAVVAVAALRVHLKLSR